MNENNNIQFSAESIVLINKIVSQYPKGKEKSALIPLLHIAQAEFDGWLSTEVMNLVAKTLNIKPIEVYEVATFYSMFNTEPVGKCVFEVCQTGPCWICGADEIISYLEQKLKIKAGETTPDGKFTIKLVECLADCGNAPVVKLGWNYITNSTKQKIDNLIEEYSNNNSSTHSNPYL